MLQINILVSCLHYYFSLAHITLILQILEANRFQCPLQPLTFFQSFKPTTTLAEHLSVDSEDQIVWHFKTWTISFYQHCLSSLNCINEFLAVVSCLRKAMSSVAGCFQDKLNWCRNQRIYKQEAYLTFACMYFIWQNPFRLQSVEKSVKK